MTPQILTNYLVFAIANNFPVLIKGRPGIGKSDIVAQAARAAKAHLIITHPVVSDPTDYKGLPFANKNGEAEFLPYSDLKKLINATEKTVFFIDDIGQAPATVQAALMQLLLAREINGHKVSDFVTFIAATNRKEDKAGVTGILEPVKSRFASIVELETDVNDWIKWALNSNMPIELIAFIRFRPETLTNFSATKDIENTPTPRTITNAGRQQAAGLPEALYYEVFKGAAGEAFAVEYTGFLRLYKSLPNVDQIILNPTTTPVPAATEPAAMYAISGALAARMNDTNMEAIAQYLDRLPGEFSVSCMKDAIIKKPELTNTRAYIQWATKTGNEII